MTNSFLTERTHSLMEPIDKDSIVAQHNDLITAVARMEKIPLKLFEMAAGLTDPVALTGDAEYQRGLLERLYPAYDRFVERFDQSTLEWHVKYVGTHTAKVPNSLASYMLKALADYENRLAKTGTAQKSGRSQISE